MKQSKPMPEPWLRLRLQNGQAPSQKAGNARNANRNGDNLNVNRNNADNHNPNRGWRAELRVF